mmetsp:Transcript_19952/g.47820  ORF Transcript_19952/g.47820 Transcript_19952/m.47820 type:complete len:273 (-) Transcript_19952:88-906(-)
MLLRIVTRQRSRAASAEAAAQAQNPFPLTRAASFGRGASPSLVSGGDGLLEDRSSAPPHEVENHDVWMPLTARDDADDAVDLEYFAVLAAAVQISPFEHTSGLGGGSSELVHMWECAEVWSPVTPREESADDVPDRDYLAHLATAMQQCQEDERRERVQALVRQQVSDEGLPLLQRDCVICTDELGDETRGPVIQLECHVSHCFHAECIARAWAGRPSRPCPCCRRPSQLNISLAGCQQWRQARGASEARVASDWEEKTDWRALAPCDWDPH